MRAGLTIWLAGWGWLMGRDGRIVGDCCGWGLADPPSMLYGGTRGGPVEYAAPSWTTVPGPHDKHSTGERWRGACGRGRMADIPKFSRMLEWRMLGEVESESGSESEKGDGGGAERRGSRTVRRTIPTWGDGGGAERRVAEGNAKCETGEAERPAQKISTTPRRLGGRSGTEALGCAEIDCRKAAPKEKHIGKSANQTAAGSPKGETSGNEQVKWTLMDTDQQLGAAASGPGQRARLGRIGTRPAGQFEKNSGPRFLKH
jgi:hypothetical protein